MKKLQLIFAIAIALSISLSSCSKKEDTNLKLAVTGLEDLGSDYAYEGWLIIDGSPVSAGIFNVDASGALSATSFDLGKIAIENATAYVLTIEPSPDTDPSASNVHILAGDITNNVASITVDHHSALGSDFTSSTGKYILATPTDGEMNNENSGVWWLDPTAGPGAGLDLPTLPAGWNYEGWAVIDGTPISTGTFTSVTGSDNAATYSGGSAGPDFPGEDFLTNAPSGVTFPTDLAGATVVISIEPSPDNSAAPFLLKPLVGPVSATATDHTPYTMTNNAANSNPTGTVTLTIL